MDNYKKREFLEPQEDGTYKYVEWTCLTCPPEDYVEIPKMAKMLTKDRNNYLTFWDGDFSRSPYIDSNWLNPDVDDVMDFAAYKQLGDFKILWKRSDQDPALISGADVPALIKKGESVQFRSVFNVQGGGEWQDLNLERDEEEFSLGDLINTRFEWRLKPQTIKLELELPKTFKPRDGDDCFIVDSEQEDGFYRFTYSEDSGFHQNFIQFGVYRTEEEIKQVVEQLRKIRGTN